MCTISATAPTGDSCTLHATVVIVPYYIVPYCVHITFKQKICFVWTTRIVYNLTFKDGVGVRKGARVRQEKRFHHRTAWWKGHLCLDVSCLLLLSWSQWRTNKKNDLNKNSTAYAVCKWFRKGWGPKWEEATWSVSAWPITLHARAFMLVLYW